jgi:hypothetical protein
VTVSLHFTATLETPNKYSIPHLHRAFLVNSKCFFQLNVRTKYGLCSRVKYNYRVFSKLRRSFQHAIVCVALKSSSLNYLSKICTAMKIQKVNFFEIFETGPASVCADLLEIRIDKKNQMSTDVNKKYCHSCHL